MFSFYAKVNKDECNIRNLTNFVFQDLYAGIPDTLLLNVVSAILLVIGFSIIRNHFDILHRDKIKKRWSVLFNSTLTKFGSVAARHKVILAKQNRINLGSFNWILETMKLNRDSILKHCGPDALYYLSFQQHLLFVMGVITCVSLCIALPVNLQGTIYQNTTKTRIGRLTLANLQPESDWLWFHVILSILYIPLIGITMHKANIPKNFLKPPTRAVMITNISRNVRDKTIIKNHLKELFPNVTIEDIQLGYDISKLILKYDEYEKVTSARRYCEIHQTVEKPIYMQSICTFKKTNAYEYYIDQEIILATKIAKLKETVLHNPLGIAFVTFSKVGDAQYIVSNFRSGSDKNWKISIAPSSLDIYYENLNTTPKKWYFKWYLANFCLFLLLFFITTPAIIVNIINLLILTKHLQDIEEFSPIISHFLPTIVLLTLKVMMPILVQLSESYLYHWTKSLEEFAIMTKTFGYLLFMTLILPSLGLTSIQAFVEWTIDSAIKETNEYRWKCVFLPNKGAFFVNYVISCAFIGNLLDLIRFPDLLNYCWLKMLSKSVAETTYIRKTVFVQFPFGIHYAWMILIFSICAVYSLLCPLITPCGILYILIKYLCDKHNLYFIYAPTNMIEKSAEMIHKTASTLTNFSAIIVLILLSAFITMRAQGLDAKSIVLLVTIIITLMLYMFTTASSKYVKKRTSTEKNMPSPPYLPKILSD